MWIGVQMLAVSRIRILSTVHPASAAFSDKNTRIYVACLALQLLLYALFSTRCSPTTRPSSRSDSP